MREYFAGGNTPNGFVSYYNDIKRGRDGCLYILKGAPGVGKSTLMRRVASVWESMGHEVEYFLCSGDTDSIDGVRDVTTDIAVIDGTAPHTVDSRLPGVEDVILNLGECIKEGIKRRAREIETAVQQKSRLYMEGYAYLSAVGTLRESLYPVEENMRRELVLRARELALEYSGEGIGEVRRLYTRAITPSGVLDVYGGEDVCISVTGANPVERGIFLEALCREVTLNGVDVLCLMDPMSPTQPVRLRLEAYGVSVGEEGFGSTTIDLGREGERSYDERVRRTMRELTELAVERFALARDIHKDAERYYVDNMDWDKYADMSDALIKKVSQKI